MARDGGRIPMSWGSATRGARAVKALPFAILVVAVAAFDLRHHEFWRDEAQALLLGRDVPIGQLYRAMRFEGSPPLLQIILKIGAAVMPSPVALVLAGAIGYAALLWGTYSLLRAISRRPVASAVVTLALAVSNTYAYELGAIVRSYGLGLGLVLGGIAQLVLALEVRRPKLVYGGAILCGLAAITSDHAACVAGAALASFALVEILGRRLRLVWPTLAALPFFALTWALMAPFPERAANVAKPGNPELQNAASLAWSYIESGALDRGWWLGTVAALEPPTLPVVPAFAAGIAIILAIRLVRRRPALRVELFPVGMILLSWATLLYIFVAWYGGGYRHHIFLWIPAFVFATGSLLDTRILRGPARLAAPILAILFVPWYARQMRLAWVDFSSDWAKPLSQTKSASGLLPARAHVVADHDYSVLGLRLWRSDLSLRSPDGLGRAFDYLIADRRWYSRVALKPIILDECRRAPDRVFLALNTEVAPRACLSLIQRRQAFLSTETFDLYRVDCGCFGR